MSNSTTTSTPTSYTVLLMTTSAVILGLFGLGALLLPEEVISILGAPRQSTFILPVKLMGSAYFAFAILNWMARRKLIGGIYSRPVSLGNFAHFLAASLVLVKQVPTTPHPGTLGALLVPMAMLAASFGYIAFARGGSCG